MTKRMSWKFGLVLVVLVLLTGNVLVESQAGFTVTSDSKQLKDSREDSVKNDDSALKSKRNSGVTIPDAPDNSSNQGDKAIVNNSTKTSLHTNGSAVAVTAVTTPEPAADTAERSTANPTEHAQPVTTGQPSNTEPPSTTELKAETSSEVTTLMTTSEELSTTSSAVPTAEKTTPTSAIPTTVAPVKV